MNSVPSPDCQPDLREVHASIYEPQNNMAQNWHRNSQSLQSPTQIDIAAPLARPAVTSSHFATVDQSQNLLAVYSVSTTTQDNANVNSCVQDPFSLPIPTDNNVSPSTNNTLDASFTSADPSWLIGYDFDLEALNTSVSTTWDTTQPLFQSHLAIQDLQPTIEDQQAFFAGAQRRQRLATDQVRKGWFTQIQDKKNSDESRFGTNVGSPVPVAAGEQYEIGDSFRHGISARLRAPIIDEPLPSTRYLVCIFFPKSVRQ